MAVADAVNMRTIAVQLRSLSSDPENQPVLARDEGCMNALIGFVLEADEQVCATAVATLKNLASHPENFSALRAEEELLEALRAIVRAKDADMGLRREAYAVIYELSDDNEEAEMCEIDEFELLLGLRKDPEPSQDDDPDLLKDPVTVRLHVPSISEEMTCVRLEQLLIRKKGVVSVVFERGAEVAVIYSRAPAEDLSNFVSKMTGARVEILPPESETDSEEEKDESEKSREHSPERKENGAGQPVYLDETGQRFKDVAKKNAKKKHTLSHGATSLSARLEAQRLEASRKQARASRLMGSIGRGFRTGWGFW